MPETMIIPWYATGFRGEGFGAALNEVAAVAMQYGASSFAVYRSNDDRYRFQQFATFDDHLDWERYWDGPEMTDFRVRHSSWYQVPVLYSPWTRTAAGTLEQLPIPDAVKAKSSPDSAPIEIAPVADKVHAV